MAVQYPSPLVFRVNKFALAGGALLGLFFLLVGLLIVLSPLYYPGDISTMGYVGGVVFTLMGSFFVYRSGQALRVPSVALELDRNGLHDRRTGIRFDWKDVEGVEFLEQDGKIHSMVFPCERPEQFIPVEHRQATLDHAEQTFGSPAGGFALHIPLLFLRPNAKTARSYVEEALRRSSSAKT